MPPHLVIWSQNGELLYNQFVSTRGDINLLINNPDRSGQLVIVLDSGAEASGESSVMLGKPYAELSQRTDVIEWVLGSPPRVPKSTNITRIDSATYEAFVKDAPSRYFLVLNDSFSPGWRIATPPGVTAEHFTANLYTNGWVIHGPEGGSYPLKISYDSRKYVQSGLLLAILLLISAFTVQGAVSLIVSRSSR
jgi:hypothetical protein